MAVTRDDFEATFGQRNDEILSVWLAPDAGVERVRRVGDAKERAYREIVARVGLEPLPGAAAWVRAQHEGGWRQAIASSAPRLNVEVMRRALGFETLIETYVGAEDVRSGKPDPEVFLTAAARLGVAPERCVVVEDAAAGVEAARRARMACVGIGPGGRKADVPVASLAELPVGTFDALLARRRPESGVR